MPIAVTEETGFDSGKQIKAGVHYDYGTVPSFLLAAKEFLTVALLLAVKRFLSYIIIVFETFPFCKTISCLKHFLPAHQRTLA
jgi:hypothetical protein